jgi:cytochrome b
MMTKPLEIAGKSRDVVVWDLPTRLFHWTLVALVAFLWASSALSLDWHMRAGEAVIALVLFRLSWGVIGSSRSRFTDFVAGPTAARRHFSEIRALLKAGGGVGDHAPTIGHTPLGGYMILVMLGLLAVQAATGLFATDDIATDGPLAHLVSGHTAKLLTGLHHLNFNLIGLCVGLHVSAALFYLLRKHENLILPLLTGRKRVPVAAAPAVNRITNPWLALALLAAAAAAGVVAGLVRL